MNFENSNNNINNVITLEMRRNYCMEGIDIMDKMLKLNCCDNQNEIIRQKEEFGMILRKSFIQLDIKNILISKLRTFGGTQNDGKILKEKVSLLESKVYTISDLFNNFSKYYKLYDITYDIFDYIYEYQFDVNKLLLTQRRIFIQQKTY